MGWFDWLLGKEKKPPEPLVLGAKLRCPYGSHDSYLYVDSQNIKINNLPKACVEDCKALLNIQPFGDCYAGGACETLMKLNSKWENPVPQGEKINGKEIITTKSLLACKVVGAEFKIISSGQDGIFAKQIMLMQEMDQKYPGLREILDNPYGSLYLNKGMYKKAIQFIEDQTKKNGGDIDSFTLFNEKNIEGIYLKSAFGHLMPYCDTSTMEGFVNGMQTAGVRQNMSGTAGWDELKINKKTIEFLKKDCKETANRIETKPFYRWQEENKVFSSAVAEGVTALAYGAVMYTGIKNANSNQNKYNKPVAQEVKNAGGGTKGTGKSINPNEIRFSQSSVNGADDIITSMKKDGWVGDSIDVVKMPDGSYTTIDNTRVAAAREAGINVQANVHNYNDPLPSNFVNRFTTPKGVPSTWGDATNLRILKQNSAFRGNYPSGSFDMPKMKN